MRRWEDSGGKLLIGSKDLGSELIKPLLSFETVGYDTVLERGYGILECSVRGHGQGGASQ